MGDSMIKVWVKYPPIGYCAHNTYRLMFLINKIIYTHIYLLFKSFDKIEPLTLIYRITSLRFLGDKSHKEL